MQTTETNLRCRLETGLSADITDDTVRLRFYDVITGEERNPLSTTKLIVMDKGSSSTPNPQYEIILLGTLASSTDGLFVYEDCQRGLAPSGSSLTANSDYVRKHIAGAEGGTVDVHYLFNTIISTLRGAGEAWTIYRAATIADRDSSIATPQDGMLCYVLDIDTLFFRINGVWRISPVPIFANTTARDAALPSPNNGDTCYVTADGVFYDYQAGAWNTRGTSTTANATQSAAGKVQLANLTAQRTQAVSDNGPYVLVPQYTIQTISTPYAASTDFTAYNGYNLLLGTDGKIARMWMDNQLPSGTAGTTIAIGDWLALGTDGRLIKAVNDTIANATVVGFAVTAASADEVVFYQTDGIYTTTGLTAGTTYYLGTGGAMTTTVARDSSSIIPVMLGRALSTTKLAVSIQRLPRTKNVSQQLVSGSGPYTVTVGFPIEYVNASAPGYFQTSGDVEVAPTMGFYNVPGNVQKSVFPNGALGALNALLVADIFSSSAQTIWTASISSDNLVLTQSGAATASMDALFTIHELI